LHSASFRLDHIHWDHDDLDLVKGDSFKKPVANCILDRNLSYRYRPRTAVYISNAAEKIWIDPYLQNQKYILILKNLLNSHRNTGDYGKIT